LGLHHLLLKLLPRARRERFGDEMADVFLAERQDAGVLGRGWLWIKEAGGLLKFAARDRIRPLAAWLARHRSTRGGRFPTEQRWAWRGVRARGWRAILVVGLLAVALAANTMLFSVADSLVFRRLPYDDVDRLVTLWASGPGAAPPRPISLQAPELLDELRARTNLFAGVHGYMRGTYTFLLNGVEARREPTALITPGLIEMLGWRPAWGRTLTDADARRTDTRAALITESLARERFGDPGLAVGRELTTADDPLQVVGVLPHGFQFPDSRDRIWRPLDHPRVTDGALYPVARLAPGVTREQVTIALTGLAHRLVESRAGPPGARVAPGAFMNAEAGPHQRRLLSVLIGAALCLLIIACANVASLELAGALLRARALAIRTALGATRGSLMRVSILEGAWLVGGALAVAWSLVWLASETLAAWLPAALTRMAANPVDLDGRALGFMAIVAAVTWFAASLPIVVYASRRDLLEVLKLEGRSAAASRGGLRLRRALTLVEIALAVVLLVGGILYTRTYIALARLDKGFDSSRLVTIGLTVPTTIGQTPGVLRAMADQVRERLRARSDVIAVAGLAANSPFDIGTSSGRAVQTEDRPEHSEPVTLLVRTADREFFDVVRIPLKRGRMFEADEPADSVLITDALATRLWPGADPIGRRFRTDAAQPWRTVVGVVGHVRFASAGPDRSAYTSFFEVYAAPARPATVVTRPAAPSPPAAPAPAAAPRPAAGPAPIAARANAPRPGAIYMGRSLIARLDARARLDDIYQDLRRIDSRFTLEVKSVDASYAEPFDDRLLAARTVGGFAILSFLVAAAGVYAVMAFLVASRTREIGVRMALGANGRDIRRLVLGSSMRLVVAGAAAGLAVAVGLSRWAESQLFGVSPTDPVTYALVAAAVTVTALAATWQPARQAARVDPVVTLRAE
jgi:putative ABC transport system permease protein